MDFMISSTFRRLPTGDARGSWHGLCPPLAWLSHAMHCSSNCICAWYYLILHLCVIGPLSQSLVPSLCQQNLSGQVVKTEVDTRRKVFLLVASDGPTLTWTCSLPVCVYLQSALPTFSMLVAFKKRPFWQIQDVESYVHMYTIVCIYLHIYIFIRVYIYLFIYHFYIYIYIFSLAMKRCNGNSSINGSL